MVYNIDLIDPQNKNFCTFQQMKQKINTNNFVKYYSLISNVPKCFKDHIKENTANVSLVSFNPVDNFFQRIVTSTKVKFIYNDFIDNVVQLPTEKFLKWEDLLSCDIVNWSKYFIILNKACKNSYLRNFQFKLLHRIIPTNSFLFKIKLTNTNLCTFCNSQEETLEHLFFDCPEVLQFWTAFTQQLRLYYADFVFDKEKVLLGFKYETLFINLLFIIAKNYIYKCKLNEQKPNITDLKYKIKSYHSMELYVAKKNNKVPVVERFWAPLQYIFPN